MAYNFINYIDDNKKTISIVGISLGILVIFSKKFLNLGLTSKSFFKMADSNSLVYPTKTQRDVSSFFGERTHPITRKSEFHNGIDIPALPKTPIYAPIDAKVVLNSYHDKGGNQLVISNGDIRLGFAHLYEKPKFKVGDKVKKGQKIALVGNTGLSTGSHLHFTLKIDNEWINPTKAFKEYANV